MNSMDLQNLNHTIFTCTCTCTSCIFQFLRVFLKHVKRGYDLLHVLAISREHSKRETCSRWAVMTSRTAGRMLHRVTLAQDTTGSDFKGPENSMFRKQNELILKNFNKIHIVCPFANIVFIWLKPGHCPALSVRQSSCWILPNFIGFVKVVWWTVVTWICQNWYTDFVWILYGFVKLVIWICLCWVRCTFNNV